MAKKRSPEIKVKFTGTPKANLVTFEALCSALGCPVKLADLGDVKPADGRKAKSK
jgi:hypothetical protein